LPALVTAAPTVRSAVFVVEPTMSFPTVVVEPVVGNVTAEAKNVEVGSNVSVPAVSTLNAVALECRPLATMRMSPPVDPATGAYDAILLVVVKPIGLLPESKSTAPFEV
jgi:hypothetical protein